MSTLAIHSESTVFKHLVRWTVRPVVLVASVLAHALYACFATKGQKTNRQKKLEERQRRKELRRQAMGQSKAA